MSQWTPTQGQLKKRRRKENQESDKQWKEQYLEVETGGLELSGN